MSLRTFGYVIPFILVSILVGCGGGGSEPTQPQQSSIGVIKSNSSSSAHMQVSSTDVVKSSSAPTTSQSHQSSIELATSSSSTISSKSALGLQREGVQSVLIGESFTNGVSGQYEKIIGFHTKDDQIAMVDNNGAVVAVGPGKTQIYVDLIDLLGNEISLAYDVNVLPKTIPIEVWAGTANSEIFFADYARGGELYATSLRNCDPKNYQTCADSFREVIESELIVHEKISLNRDSRLTLKHGSNLAGVEFTANKFSPVRDHAAAVFNEQLIITGGTSNFYHQNTVFSSSDGTTWKPLIGSSFNPRSYHTLTAFRNQLWLIGGLGPEGYSTDKYKNDIWSSSDAKDWLRVSDAASFPKRQKHNTVVFENRLLVLGGIGENGLALTDIWASPDGVQWEQINGHADFLGGELQDTIVLNNKLFVLVKNNSMLELWVSADGREWSNTGLIPFEKTPHIQYGYRMIEKNGSIWLVGTGENENDILEFSDAQGWKKISPAVDYGVRLGADVVSYKNKIYVIGGETAISNPTNDVWVTENGIDWSELDAGPTFPRRNSHQSVFFKNKFILIGGVQDGINLNNPETSYIWSSLNGIKWKRHQQKAGFHERSNHRLVEYNSQIWLIGGSDSNGLFNDVWSSNDGLNWEQKISSANFSKRRSPAIVEFKGELWLIGGFDGKYKNDIWSSKNGIDWELKNNSAEFTPRASHEVISTGNKLVLIGGAGSNYELSDIWSSTDGITWVQETQAAPFLPKLGFSLGKLGSSWFIAGGGAGAFEADNEVWQSDDGITWRQVQVKQKFTKRKAASLIVNNGELTLLGGTNTDELLRDVWVSADGVNWRKGHSFEFTFAP